LLLTKDSVNNSNIKMLKLNVKTSSRLNEMKNKINLDELAVIPVFESNTKVIKSLQENKRLDSSSIKLPSNMDISLEPEIKELRIVKPCNKDISSRLSSIDKLDQNVFDCIKENNKKLNNVRSINENPIIKPIRLDSLNDLITDKPNFKVFNNYVNKNEPLKIKFPTYSKDDIDIDELIKLRNENWKEIKNSKTIPKLEVQFVHENPNKNSIFLEFETNSLIIKPLKENSTCNIIKTIPSHQIISLFYHFYDFVNTQIYSYIMNFCEELKIINERLYIKNDNIKEFLDNVELEIKNLKKIHDEEILHNFNTKNKSELFKKYKEDVII
jgi:hypothetical protein